MRIVIAGAHGQIGMRLVKLLAGSGHEPVGLIRNPDQSDEIRSAGGEPIVCDLEQADVGEVREAVAGADAAVFAAGAGPGSGPERKKTMDRDGAIKLAEALAGTDAHYVMVSSMGADPESEAGDMAVYQRAKGEADEALRASGLRHTIVRPGALTDDAGTGRVRIGQDVGRAEVPRDDVAAVLAAVLERGGPANATLELVSGDDEIADALEAPS